MDSNPVFGFYGVEIFIKYAGILFTYYISETGISKSKSGIGFFVGTPFDFNPVGASDYDFSLILICRQRSAYFMRI